MNLLVMVLQALLILGIGYVLYETIAYLVSDVKIEIDEYKNNKAYGKIEGEITSIQNVQLLTTKGLMYKEIYLQKNVGEKLLQRKLIVGIDEYDTLKVGDYVVKEKNNLIKK